MEPNAQSIPAWPGHARSHVRLCLAVYDNEQLLRRPRVPCACIFLSKLSDYHQQILCLRFGIDASDPLAENEPLTITQASDQLGKIRESMRQSELLALSKLRQIWAAIEMLGKDAA